MPNPKITLTIDCGVSCLVLTASQEIGMPSATLHTRTEALAPIVLELLDRVVAAMAVAQPTVSPDVADNVTWPTLD